MQLADTPFGIIPVVSPVSADPGNSGKVRNLAVGGGINHDQLAPVRNHRNEIVGYELRAAYQRQGWILLEDLYRAEHDEGGWERYKRYLKDIRANPKRSLPSFPPHLLPQEVQRRMKASLPTEWETEWEKLKTGAEKVVEGKPDKPADEPAKPSKRNAAPEARS